MGSQDPEIVLFKSGYQWRALSMTSGPQQGLGPLVRTSRWNGQTIELKKFKGDPKVYAGTLSGVLTGVGYGGCGWKKIPRMIIALNNEDETLKR